MSSGVLQCPAVSNGMASGCPAGWAPGPPVPADGSDVLQCPADASKCPQCPAVAKGIAESRLRIFFVRGRWFWRVWSAPASASQCGARCEAAGVAVASGFQTESRAPPCSFAWGSLRAQVLGLLVRLRLTGSGSDSSPGLRARTSQPRLRDGHARVDIELLTTDFGLLVAGCPQPRTVAGERITGMDIGEMGQAIQKPSPEFGGHERISFRHAGTDLIPS